MNLFHLLRSSIKSLKLTMMNKANIFIALNGRKLTIKLVLGLYCTSNKNRKYVFSIFILLFLNSKILIGCKNMHHQFLFKQLRKCVLSRF